MATPRRIAIITGSRAEFGLLEPVLGALTSRPAVRPQLIVTGMHLLAKFGRSVDHIRAAGWRVDAAVPMQTGRDDPDAEPQALARGIAGIAAALKRLRSDIVVVLGDRIEAFAGACAAAVGRRVLAHIHGGDRAPGDLDDSLRNAITRLAHVHFAASREAAERLRRMGEESWRIFTVGAPGLDAIRSPARSVPAELRPAGRYAVVIQHPIGRDAAREAAVMRAILKAVRANRLNGAILYPSSDPGHTGIIQAIRQWGRPPGWNVFRSLPRTDYLALAKGSAVLVGNSSSGIIESASLGVPAVNVGDRQAGRLKCGPNVIDCGETFESIRRAIGRALKRPRQRPGRSVYGDGRAGQRIARTLERLALTPALLRKRLAW